MRVNVNQEVLSFNGKKIETPDGYLTYKDLILTVLTAQAPDENDTPEVKRDCFRLASVVANSNRPTFSTKDAGFIVTRAEKHASSLGLGRLEELFDAPETEDTTPESVDVDRAVEPPAPE